MFKELQDVSAGHAPNYSLAYPQARPWGFLRSVVRGLLLVSAAWVLAATVSLLMPSHPRSGQLHFPHTNYVLVIDAGSSGTRMYAYNWTLPVYFNNNSLPIVQAVPPAAAAHLVPKKPKAGLYNRVETQPGLDAYAEDLAGLSAHAVEPLLAWARAVVPAHQHADTPLFLLATGGLRRMEQHARDKLMHIIIELLQQSGFRFQPSWANVMTGTQEGLYGWLSLNYELGLLKHPMQTPAASTPPSHGTVPADGTVAGAQLSTEDAETMGALDMGGSSLEMTFMVSVQVTNLSDTSWLQNVTLADRVFHLHTHTFEHYGLNEAYDRAVTLLLAQQQQKTHSQQEHGDADVTQQGAADLAPVLHPSSDSISREQGSPGSSTASSGSNSNMDPVAHELQVDLAAAAAAGLQVEPLAGSAGDMRDHSVAGSSTVEQADPLEQQRQVDLAIAAAAGLHIKPPAEPNMNQNILVREITPDNASNSSSADPSSGVATAGATNISKAATNSLVSHSGALQAHQIDSASSDEVTAGGAQESAGMRDKNSSTISSDAPGSVAMGAQRGLQLLHVAMSSLHQSTSQARLLLQLHKRQQRRYQRHLLLQQHQADMMQGWQGAFSRRAEELEDELLRTPSQHVQDLSVKQVQHCQGFAGLLHDADVSDDQQSDQQITDGPYMSSWSASRHLLIRGLPPAVTSPGQPERQQQVPAHQDSTGSAFSSASDLRESAASVATSAAGTGDAADDRTSRQEDTVNTGLMHAVISSPTARADEARDAASELPVIWHPCLHAGYQAAYPRLALNGQQPNPAKVMLEGRPDWVACRQLVDKVVDAAAPCDPTPQRPSCRLGSAQPALQGRFLALTGFYIVHKFLRVPPNAPLDTVLDAAQELCARPWSWVQQHLGQQMNAERYCTWGPYIVTLLKDGLKLTDAAVNISSTDVGWPLGAALAEASKLPEFVSRRLQQPGTSKRQRQNFIQSQIDAAGSAVDVKPGLLSADVTAAGGGGHSVDYSQRNSWAQRFWGSHKHMHMGHVFSVMVCVVAWLTFVVYCLPTKPGHAGHHVSAVLSGPWSVPVQYHLYGSPGLPVVANGYSRGRPSPSSSRVNPQWIS